MGVVDTKVPEGKNFLSDAFAVATDNFFDKIAQNAADKVQEKINQDLDPTNTAKPAKIEANVQADVDKVTALKAAQDFADTRRFAKEEKERKEREAQAAAAAQAAYEATIDRGRIAKGNIIGGGGDNGGGSGSGGGTFNPSNPLASSGIAPTPSVQPSRNTKTDSDNYGGRSGGYGGYTGSPGGRNTGGLVSAPAAKQKNKKQTTQRRKGLGTRP